MRLYAVLDLKANALSAFHVLKSDAVASRDFAQAVLEPKSIYGKYADDFQLVVLADVREDVGDQTRQGTELVALLDHGYDVVVTARQVVDLQPKAGQTADPAQLALLREA